MQQSLNTSHQNLQRLLASRAIMLVLQWSALCWGMFMLPDQLHILPLATTLTISTLLLLAQLWRLRQAWPVSEQEFFAHLLVDITLLTVLLYFSGGATSPFASFYLVSLSISAAILSARFTWILTTLSLAAYSTMLFQYVPVEWLAPEHHHHGNAFSPHILGMWGMFSISAILITYFVSHMANTLRQRNAELSLVREQRLRDEQLLGIATLAAGTVHELGTPLATMAILTEGMHNAATNNPELLEDTTLLSQQITVCKNILQNLATTAEQQKSGVMQRVLATHYLEQVLTHWQLLRPEIPLHFHSTTAVMINADSTLEQAIINLLNNAADANNSAIEVTLNNDHDSVTLAIRDHGTGLTIASEKLGTPFVSSKGAGRGLGLFLSNAAIERLGGTVMLQDHPDGGALSLIRLPIAHD